MQQYQGCSYRAEMQKPSCTGGGCDGVHAISESCGVIIAHGQIVNDRTARANIILLFYLIVERHADIAAV